MTRFFFLVCAAPALLLIGLADTAAATEARCVRGDDAVRRVAIEVQDPSQGAPCEVVYWKDSEEPGVRNVLWRAQTDAAYCAAKAEELVGTLKSGGWSCTSTDEQPRSAAVEAAPPVAPPTETAEPNSPSIEAEPSAPAVEAEPSSPPDDARPEVAEDQPPASPSPPSAPPEDDAAETSPPMRAALAPEQQAAEPDGAPSDNSSRASALDAIIAQNLTRLNDGVDGKFEAEVAEYGDLDGDGLADGLVFFTYESQRLEKARFVAAYLFDGDSYALAATKPLAGSEDNVHSADIESIENGVISLRLTILEPGDASCCPSGERRQALMLRDGQLVEARSAADAQRRS